MRRVLSLSVTVALCGTASAQAPATSKPPQPVLIKAGRLIDGRSEAPQANVGILIDGERIRAVGPLARIQAQAGNARVVDLSKMTALPGLIDTHTA
ncbi:MAG: hypothetical protein ACREOG_09755 [Gemmatimonadaceae bacterium]